MKISQKSKNDRRPSKKFKKRENKKYPYKNRMTNSATTSKKAC